jgi:hypothetical protein
LNRAREHSGAISDTEFAKARTRTLAKVADVWNANPPFRTEDFEKSKSQEWYPEWERSYRANTALINAAKAECERIRCNGAQPGAAGDAR